MTDCSAPTPSSRPSRPSCGAPALDVLLDTGVPLLVGQRVRVLVPDEEGVEPESKAPEAWQVAIVTFVSPSFVRVLVDATSGDVPWHCEVGTCDVATHVAPIISSQHNIERTVGARSSANLPERVSSYRSQASRERREAARCLAEARALRRAAVWHVLVLGSFCAQLAAMGGRMDSRPYLLELYSGPFRSMSHALQRGFARVATITLDINRSFAPDVVADLSTWNMWRWLLQQGCMWSPTGRLWLPACLHFSPPCSTWARASWFRGRCRSFVGGYADDIDAQAANACAYSICYLLSQVRAEHLPISYIIENPAGSMLWQLPCMVALMAVSTVLDVSYCLHGSGVEKRTRFVCSPDMRFPWATPAADSPPGPTCLHYFRSVCRGDGGCGRMVASAAPSTLLADSTLADLHHCGRAGGFSIADAEIPFALAVLLHRAWTTVDSIARAHTPSLVQVDPLVVCRLANDWAMEFGAHPADAELQPVPAIACSCDCQSCQLTTESGRAAAALLALHEAALVAPLHVSAATLPEAPSALPVAVAYSTVSTTTTTTTTITAGGPMQPLGVRAVLSRPAGRKRKRRDARQCDRCGVAASVFQPHGAALWCLECIGW